MSFFYDAGLMDDAPAPDFQSGAQPDFGSDVQQAAWTDYLPANGFAADTLNQYMGDKDVLKYLGSNPDYAGLNKKFGGLFSKPGFKFTPEFLTNSPEAQSFNDQDVAQLYKLGEDVKAGKHRDYQPPAPPQQTPTPAAQNNYDWRQNEPVASTPNDGYQGSSPSNIAASSSPVSPQLSGANAPAVASVLTNGQLTPAAFNQLAQQNAEGGVNQWKPYPNEDGTMPTMPSTPMGNNPVTSFFKNGGLRGAIKRGQDIQGVVQPASYSPSGGSSSYANAISGIESGGSKEPYQLLGPVTAGGDRAYGKYQIMGNNIPTWSQEVLGQPISKEQFLADPKLQDQIFNAKFGQYVQKYGPEGAARAWFAGEGGMNNPNAKDVLGTSVQDYSNKFNRALGGSRPALPPSSVNSLQPPANPLAPVSRETQAQRPSWISGQMSVPASNEQGADPNTKSDWFNFVTGTHGPRTTGARGSAAFGDYQLGQFGKYDMIGGSKLEAFPTSQQIYDPAAPNRATGQPGDVRSGIFLHPAGPQGANAQTLDRLQTLGCFGIPNEQWPAARDSILNYMRNTKTPVALTFNPDGTANIRPGNSVMAVR